MAFSLEVHARSIVLTGLMGTGKTSVGRLLANRLALPFHDSDEALVAASGRTVAQIFAEEGEAAFREQERTVIAALLQEPRAVISTGGGAILYEGTRALLAEHAWTVWLDAAPAILAARLAGKSDRPLLSGGDAEQILSLLLAERVTFYSQADLRLPVGGRTPDQVADTIIASLASSPG